MNKTLIKVRCVESQGRHPFLRLRLGRYVKSEFSTRSSLVAINIITLLLLAFLGFNSVHASEVTGTLSSDAPGSHSTSSGTLDGGVSSGSVVSGTISGGTGGGGSISGTVTGGSSNSGGGGGGGSNGPPVSSGGGGGGTFSASSSGLTDNTSGLVPAQNGEVLGAFTAQPNESPRFPNAGFLNDQTSLSLIIIVLAGMCMASLILMAKKRGSEMV